MNIGTISLPPAVAKLGLAARRNWPTIATVAGCAGVVTSTLMACGATRKLDDVLDGHKYAIENVDMLTTVDEHDAKAEKARIFASTAVKLGKLYGPAILVQIGSIGLIGSSHVEMIGRQAALSAAYTSAVSTFDAYRERIRKQIGSEEEFKAYYGLTEEETVREELNEETGRKRKVKENLLVLEVDPSDYTRYARCFCRFELTPDGGSTMGSREWTNDSATNLFFLKERQNWANDKLHAYGWLSLNDVYDMLGFDRIPEGQVLGWVDDPEHTKTIDFGIYNLNERTNQIALNQPATYAPAIMLDFNIDPVTLYDKESSFRS